MLEIAKEDIISRLQFDNPWWETGSEEKIIYEDTPRRKYFETFSQNILNTSVHRAIVLMGDPGVLVKL